MQEIQQKYTKLKSIHLFKMQLKTCVHPIGTYKYLFAYAYKFN